jgi:hypothetical protein
MGGGGRAALVVGSIKSYKGLNAFGFSIPNDISKRRQGDPDRLLYASS